MMGATAFVTGSWAYGQPNENSDVDLVVLVTPRDMATLENWADKSDGPKEKRGDSDAGPPAVSVSLRFGALNLICTTDPVVYAVWAKGTKHLRRAFDAAPEYPFGRDLAVAFFSSLRRQHGVDGNPDEEMAGIDDIRRQLEEQKINAPF